MKIFLYAFNKLVHAVNFRGDFLMKICEGFKVLRAKTNIKQQ